MLTNYRLFKVMFKKRENYKIDSKHDVKCTDNCGVNVSSLKLKKF